MTRNAIYGALYASPTSASDEFQAEETVAEREKGFRSWAQKNEKRGCKITETCEGAWQNEGVTLIYNLKENSNLRSNLADSNLINQK